MIIYTKLEKILRERNIHWNELCRNGIATDVPTKIALNMPVSTDTIDKLCAYLNVQPVEIMEWIDEEPELSETEIMEKIATLRKALSDKRKECKGMTETVRKEYERQVRQINSDLIEIIEDSLPTHEITKIHFNGIRILVDYCERLALEGESAIERL